MALTHALVLTAGLGTRLRPLTLVRAKPAVPLGGTPLVIRIARWLASYGVTDLVLNLHYLPESIAGVLGEGLAVGARVRYSWEQPILGSAGGPRLAAPIVGADPFLIVNGDTLTDVDLAAVEAAHASSDALVTMALVPNTHPEQYGGVLVDDAGRVTGFVPRGPRARSSFHFIGVQVAAAAAFDGVRAGEAASSVGGVYERLLAARPGSIRGFVSNARFWDIGTVTDYWRTSVAFADSHGNLARGAGVRIAASASVTHAILWDRVTIGPDARVDGCIVTDDVDVPRGARYAGAVLTATREGLVATHFAPCSARVGAGPRLELTSCTPIPASNAIWTTPDSRPRWRRSSCSRATRRTASTSASS